MKKYDGFIYGNGLSLNLLHHLKPLIDTKKQYLLNIDDFLKAFISKELNPREENKLFSLAYKSKTIENQKYFEMMRNEIKKYYNIHDANIEYWLGVDLFREKDCVYNFGLIKTIFPMLYNIWHEILLDYLLYSKLDEAILNFENSVLSIFDEHPIIFTTNFDRFTDGLKPKHLHGIFISNIKKLEELILIHKNKNEFLYKCIWGWNGIGKLNFINEIKAVDGYEKYFDFDFFFNKDLKINNLLIYGIGFQKSGYLNEISQVMPKYKKPTIGGIIDEHILVRLKALQQQGLLHNITFAYYSENDLEYYKSLTESEYFNLQNVEYLSTDNFNFSI